MPSIYNFTNITVTLGFYSMIAVSAFGILTNLLNIQVSVRKEMRKTAMGFYNIIISTINCIYLSLALINGNYLTTSQYACILIPYFLRVMYQMSSWLNVMILFDRMILITHNKRRINEVDNFEFNLRKVSLVVFGLLAMLCFINVPNLLFHLQTQTFYNSVANTTIVYLSCTSDSKIILIRDILSSVSRVFLPLIIGTIINGILISKLLRYKPTTGIVSQDRELKFARTIIILNVIYGVSNLISVVTLILINVYGYNQTLISTTSNESAIASFAYVCANIFGAFVNCDLIFFINILSNKRFREEADQLLNRNRL